MRRADPAMPRVVLAGSVGSSRRTLDGLIRHGANLCGVLGLTERQQHSVSGYVRLDDLAQSHGVPYLDFDRINDDTIHGTLEQWAPDLLFVVGLSQIVRPRLLRLPPLGCVGFHPTWLPEGRGRAPAAWLVLDGTPGAATFFLMDEGADSGPILVQEPFRVRPNAYASDVTAEIEQAIDRALDRLLPNLIRGHIEPQPQDEEAATWNGVRRPEDGLIDWQASAAVIAALVRSASRPHPGAYTFLGDLRMIVWQAEVVDAPRTRGVVGRLLLAESDTTFLVQTGEGVLRLQEVEVVGGGTELLRVGRKLGYAPQDEIHRLRLQVAKLEADLARLLAHDAGRAPPETS